jgi:hypothetical protein
MKKSLIPCPSCSHGVSTAATSCPQCGHPLTPIKSPEEVARAEFDLLWKRILRRAFAVATLLTLPSLTLPTLVAKLTSQGLAGTSDFEKLLHTFMLTAPLSLTVGLLVVVVLQLGWEGIKELFEGGLPTFIFVLLCISTLLAAPAFLIGSLVTNPPVDVMHVFTNVWGMQIDGFMQSLIVKPILFIYLVLTKYWNVYGPWPFTTAFIVGVFWGWSAFRLAQHKQELTRRMQTLWKEY